MEQPAASEYTENPVVIVGMACRLPGGVTSPSELWNLLISGKSGQCAIPSTRFNAHAFYHPNGDRPGSMNTSGGYFLHEDVRGFDAEFFGINNNEARRMDPQQRKLLEVVYECFENAGASLESVRGESIGCYVGNFTVDFTTIQTKDPEYLDRYSATGMGTTLLSNRISHVFDLRGPSVVLDTACSSSLYALHTAYQDLMMGQCDGALVAGANLITSPEQHLGTMKAGVLSPTSTCHTFDTSADGYGRAEGIGALYLKRLSKARADGDEIRAIIRSTAVNASGKTPGITQPSARAQEAAIRQAYKSAGLDLDTVDYVECHGTGTALGDVIECEALSRVFKRSTTNPLLIGSVKTNLGHSEAASGISSVMKVVLSMDNGQIPATIGIETLNPSLNLAGSNITVVQSNVPWQRKRGRIAGVSGFGYGGANAHIVIESTEALDIPRRPNGVPDHDGLLVSTETCSFILPVSAGAEDSIKKWLRSLSQLKRVPHVSDLAYTLGVRRSHLAARTFFVVNQEGLQRGLNSMISEYSMLSYDTLPLAFVFSGQGAQWPGMAKGLMKRFPIFRETIHRLEKVLVAERNGPNWSLEDVFEGEASERIHEAEISQTCCTALQIGIVNLLNYWGLHATRVVGHSSGEIAAAYCAGFLNEAHAILVAFYRGKAIRAVNGGAMLVTDAAQDTVQNACKELKLVIYTACINSPKSVTFSGSIEQVCCLRDALTAKSYFSRILQTDGRAYHSPHMNTAGERYQAMLTECFKTHPLPNKREMKISMISSVTGTPISGPLGPGYWRQNLQTTVAFQEAFQAMLHNSSYHCVEIGPHSTLKSPMQQTLHHLGRGAEGRNYSSCLSRSTNPIDGLLTAVGSLYLAGHVPDFGAVNAFPSMPQGTLLPNLPPYKWHYQDVLWLEPRASKEFRMRKHSRSDLLGSLVPCGSGMEYSWRNLLKLIDVPWLEDHKLGSNIVFPAAGYLAMAIEACRQAKKLDFDPAHIYHLRAVSFSRTLVFQDSQSPVEVFTSLRPLRLSNTLHSTKWYEFSISTYDETLDASTAHCAGEICTSLDGMPPALNLPPRNHQSVVSSKQWYGKLSDEGLNFGPHFQSIEEFQTCVSGAKSAITLARYLEDAEARPPYVIHPITIDSCLQSSIVAGTGGNTKELQCKIPVFITSCAIRGREKEYQSPFETIEASITSAGLNTSIAHATLTSADQRCLVHLQGVKLSSYEANTVHSTRRHPCLRVLWKPDISRLTYPGTKLESLLPLLGRSHPAQSATLLGTLDLLVHKDPTMSILQLGGNRTQTEEISKLLGLESTFKRCATYTAGGLKGDGFVPTEISHPSINNSKMTAAGDEKFDLVIVISEHFASEHQGAYTNQLKSLLSPRGCILSSHSKASEIAISDLNMVNFRLHVDGSEPVLLGIKKPAEDESVPNEVILISSDPKNPYVAALETVLNQHVKVNHYHVDDLQKINMKPHSSVISMIEIEKPFLSTISAISMASLKAMISSASSLVWVTTGSPLYGTSPETSLCSGLSRALMLEQPSLRFCVFSIDSAFTDYATTALNVIGTVCNLDHFPNKDFEYAQDSNGIVMISRFVPAEELNRNFEHRLLGKKALLPLQTVPLARIAIERPGMFDTLFFRRVDVEDIGPFWEDHFVEVETSAVGLNAKDVYTLGGRVDTPGSTCSLECTGTVRQIGSAVTSVEVGDKVVVMAPGHFQTVERYPDWACERLLLHESFTEMATLPVVYATALYALEQRAGLKRNETILIHSGAGGVGLAAIEVAQHIGAEIFVTVGTEAKAEFLSSRFNLPRSHIFSSRDSSFASGVLAATFNTGVDVVLNSLTGELLHDSWRCCASFGRFVEIGKRDIDAAGKLDMAVFGRNVAFTAFDLSALYYSGAPEHRRIWHALLGKVLAMYRQGILGGIKPCKVFDSDSVTEAFRYFSSQGRMGKIVVSFENKHSIIRTDLPKYITKLSSGKSYLLVGCLGGLGRSLSQWMFSRGARNFVFLSRTGDTKPAAQKMLRELQALGANTHVVVGDVIAYEDVTRAVSECSLPIGGVVQAAMGLEESLFASMSSGAWHRAVDPKVQGTLNLEASLAEQDSALDFFLLLSSVSGSVGTATETNYCAANAFLDAFARYRRSLGKPAVSVGLGMIADVGYLHENPEIGNLLLRKGIQPLSEEEFLQIVDLALDSREDEPETSHILTGLEPMALQALWKKGFAVTNQVLEDPRAVLLASFARSHQGATPGSLVGANGSLDSLLQQLQRKLSLVNGKAEAEELVRACVKKQLSNLLLIPLERIDGAKPLAAFGIDSMIASELRSWFYKTFALDVTFQVLLSSTATVESLVVAVLEGLNVE